MASLIFIPVNFLVTHGVSKKTIVAFFSTLIVFSLVGVFSYLAIEIFRLTGFSSEEASFLSFYQPNVDMKGILLAGIMIGALGVLDDITVSQASIVFQLKEVDKNLSQKELFFRAMNVGRDHIASMINTLFLVYAGASLPLLMLFVNNPHPVSEIINYEIIAEEIVRTLIGSIGLILAVSITTYLGCWVSKKK